MFLSKIRCHNNLKHETSQNTISQIHSQPVTITRSNIVRYQCHIISQIIASTSQSWDSYNLLAFNS